MPPEPPSDSTPVQINTLHQGSAVCSSEGYLLKKASNVAAFYLDGWGKTARIYPVSTCSTTIIYGESYNYPSMTIEDGEDESALTDIYFPEFAGWDIHSVSGGKTMAICLVKE